MNDTELKFRRSILAGRTLHAYFLTGSDTELTDGAARRAASLMLYGREDVERLPNDPDYMEYEGSVTIGEFRENIRPEIYRETYGSSGRVVVMRSAHLLTQLVQNAMLKVLEEPPEDTHFILTGNEYGVLSTIRSRCMILRLPSGERKDVIRMLIEKGASEKEAALFADMSGGITGRALRLYEDEDLRTLRKDAIASFEAALAGRPDYSFSKQKYARADLYEANEFLLLYCHDLMLSQFGMEPEYCPDRAEWIKKHGLHFTIGQIGCIIDRLTENAERLMSNSSGGAAFDRLFSELALLSRKYNKQE